jgi:hypothetical protein
MVCLTVADAFHDQGGQLKVQPGVGRPLWVNSEIRGTMLKKNITNY